jgi:hypothetical protein
MGAKKKLLEVHMIIEQVHQQLIQGKFSTTADGGAQWIAVSKNDEKIKQMIKSKKARKHQPAMDHT